MHSSIKEISDLDFEFSLKLYVLGDSLAVKACGNTKYVQKSIVE